MQVIELRNYLLAPGKTRDFIRYFEEHFLQSQRDQGMDPLGQFELVGEPDRFVWIRAFQDMPARLRGLTGFYSGPFWLARRDVAGGRRRGGAGIGPRRDRAGGGGLLPCAALGGRRRGRALRT